MPGSGCPWQNVLLQRRNQCFVRADIVAADRPEQNKKSLVAPTKIPGNGGEKLQSERLPAVKGLIFASADAVRGRLHLCGLVQHNMSVSDRSQAAVNGYG